MNAVRPGALVTPIDPWCRSTIAFAIESPRPLPGAFRCARRIGLVEPIEHERHVIGGNPLPRVDHRQHDRVALAVGAQLDVPAGRRVAQGVGEQVLDHLLDPIGIGDDLIRLVRHRHVHLDLAHPRLVLVPQHDVLEHPLDREQPRVERADAALQPRQVQQVVDDAIEADGLALDGVEVALAGYRGSSSRSVMCSVSR